MRPLGVHTSIKNTLFNSINEALQLKCNTFQIFLHSPRVWKIQSFSVETIEKFKKQRKEAKLNPFIVHASYLINFFSSNSQVVESSKRLFLEELTLAEELEADYYVIHLNDNKEIEKNRIFHLLNRIFKEINRETKKCKILIENTAKGRITSTITEILNMIYKVNSELIGGVCIDTCHLFAAGYNISDDTGISLFMDELIKSDGIDFIKLIHLNDSRTPVGSGVDRHEHIGEGYIGIEGFKKFLKIREFMHLPLILETPKKTLYDDIKNLNTVRNILKKLES